MSKALVEGKYFRVYPISKVVGVDNTTHDLDITTCDIKEGLAIEKRCKDKEHYYVVAFVKPYIKKSNSLNGATIEFASMVDGVELKDVEFRTIDMIDEDMSMEDFWEMMQEYKNCVNFAYQAILDLQEEK
jgi:hypothetical protein